jgi:hypothetical protein
MDDLISRQSAIDALLHNQEVYSNNFGDDAIDKYTVAIIDNDAQTIAQLPSARAVEVVYCKDCEYFKEIDPCFGECLHLPNGLVNDLFWYCADGERKEE